MNFHPADALGHIWDITWAHWVFGLTERRPGPGSAALQGRRSSCSSERRSHSHTHSHTPFLPSVHSISAHNQVFSFPALYWDCGLQPWSLLLRIDFRPAVGAAGRLGQRFPGVINSQEAGFVWLAVTVSF